MKGTPLLALALFGVKLEDEVDRADVDGDDEGLATDAEVERLALAKSDGSVEALMERWVCLSTRHTHRSMLLLFDAKDIGSRLCKKVTE